MAFQEFELNMIPHGDMPSFYASQYETGRPIIIDIMMGEDAFNCEALYIELHCRKVDDNIVTLEPDSVDDNQVTFIGTDQLFACPGKNIAEICLYADETKDTSLGSLNFVIEVEPDPLAGGLTSESSIYDLRQQIEEITEEVIGDDYYDKTEVDALLDLKADKSTTYTKTEVDNALNLKADKSTTYTKSQVDSALALKADASSVYTKGQTDTLLNAKANTSDLATVATTGSYNDLTNKPTIPAAQVQSDYEQADSSAVDYIKNKPDLSVYVTNEDLADAIYSLLPVDSASGAIANFETDLALDLVSCKASIVASQPSGTPTPSSPLAISGYTGVNLSVCGTNLWDEEWDVGLINVLNGNNGTDPDCIRSKNYISVVPNTTYFVMKDTTKNYGNLRFCRYDADKNFIDAPESLANATLSMTSETHYIRFYTRISSGTVAYSGGISVNYPSTDTSYHAYDTNSTTYSVSWQDEAGTVYGGNLDLTTGVLTVTHGEIDSYNGESINEPWLSSKDVYTEGGTPTTGAQVVYPLTTPVTYQLTPTQVRALVGVNNVFNDTNGNTEVKFKDSIQHYIDTRS